MPTFTPVEPPKSPDECQPWLFEAIKRLNRAATRSNQGLAAIIRGEAPDSAGTSLVDLTKFFVKPGLGGGQIGFGGTNANDNLYLSSTASADKGFIYLGYPTATATVDEDVGLFGIGTTTPSAKLHIHLASPGTSTVGSLGTVWLKSSTVESGSPTDVMTWAAFQNNAGQYDIAVLSGGLAAARGIFFTNFSLDTGLRMAYGTLLGGGSNLYVHLQFGGLAATGFSKNNNLLLLGMNDNVGSTARADFRRFWFGTHTGTGEGSVAVTALDTLVSFNVDADDYANSAVTSRPSVLIGPRVTATTVASTVIINSSTTVNGFEVRKASTGSAGSLALGARKIAIGPGVGGLTGEGAILGYISDVECLRLSPIGSANLQWAFLSAAGLVQLAHAVTTGLWGDALAGNSNRIELGDVASSVRAAALTSAGGNTFNRFGITTVGMTIENTTLGGGAAGISAPVGLLYLVNNATNGTDATIMLSLRSKRSGQSGNYLEIINSTPTTIFKVDSTGAQTITQITGTVAAAYTLKLIPAPLVGGLGGTNDTLILVAPPGSNQDLVLYRNSTDLASVGKITAAGKYCMGTITPGSGTPWITMLSTQATSGSTPFINASMAHNASVGGFNLLNITGTIGSTSATGVNNVAVLAGGLTVLRSIGGVTGFDFTVDVSGFSSSPGTAIAAGLNFFVFTSGSVDMLEADGLSVSVVHNSTGVIPGIFAGRFDASTGAGAGLADLVIGIDVTTTLDGDATDSYGIRIQTPSITATVGTRYGLYIGDQTGAATNWAIYSLGGPSVHVGKITIGSSTAPVEFLDLYGNLKFPSGGNLITDTTTGTKLATATNQKLSLWNATPIVQPTTAVAAATRVGGLGAPLTDTDTFDGYTVGQIIKALRNIGVVA